jgi:hypothetical protein
MLASSRRPARASTTGTGRRMLAAVALAGAATLLVACATDPGSAPTSPPFAVPGADPAPIDDAVLAASGLFEGLSEDAVEVRWMEPGESIAVVLGGSGAGGECIAQPHAAGLDTTDDSIVVRFDPPNPEAMCTMDFRLHGWELALAEPIDASRTVPVRLVNMSGAEETVELELGPDDLLVPETADPQPSEIPDAGATPAPEPIPAAQLPRSATALPTAQQLQVQWLEPGVSLAVLLAGSGTEACVPQPIGAKSTGPGSVEVAFEPATGTSCTDDLVVYGWRIALPEAVSATLPVDVRVTGASDAGAFVDLTLEPGDVLELR